MIAFAIMSDSEVTDSELFSAEVPEIPEGVSKDMDSEQVAAWLGGQGIPENFCKEFKGMAC